MCFRHCIGAVSVAARLCNIAYYDAQTSRRGRVRKVTRGREKGAKIDSEFSHHKNSYYLHLFTSVYSLQLSVIYSVFTSFNPLSFYPVFEKLLPSKPDPPSLSPLDLLSMQSISETQGYNKNRATGDLHH